MLSSVVKQKTDSMIYPESSSKDRNEYQKIHYSVWNRAKLVFWNSLTRTAHSKSLQIARKASELYPNLSYDRSKLRFDRSVTVKSAEWVALADRNHSGMTAWMSISIRMSSRANPETINPVETGYTPCNQRPMTS